MAETKTTSPNTVEQDRLEAFAKWLKANERAFSIGLVAVAVVAAGVWFYFSAQARRETFAQRELDQARASVDAGNLPLASSDLSSIASSFGGTAAGQEAQLLLGEVRLRQGQAALAVTELQRFVDGDPNIEYRAQAYDLLGVALEQTGQLRAAGEAFERGAEAAGEADYSLMKANLLLNAGRSFAAAADTAAAIRALERVLAEHDETTAASEARLRLAELGRYED